MSHRIPHYNNAFTPTAASKAVTALLARTKTRFFNLNYSPKYETFITHHVLSDPQHPLHLQRLRVHKNRKREGLWWHVVSTVDLAKSSVVRNTCRKKLNKAFVDALRERGFDEHGKIAEIGAVEKHLGVVEGRWEKPRDDIALSGSLKLRVLPALIPAQYAEIKLEADVVAEALVAGLKKEMVPNRQSSRIEMGSSHRDARSKDFTPSAVPRQTAAPKSTRSQERSQTWQESRTQRRAGEKRT
jgi:hypothetical protein